MSKTTSFSNLFFVVVIAKMYSDYHYTDFIYSLGTASVLHLNHILKSEKPRNLNTLSFPSKEIPKQGTNVNCSPDKMLKGDHTKTMNTTA